MVDKAELERYFSKILNKIKRRLRSIKPNWKDIAETSGSF